MPFYLDHIHKILFELSAFLLAAIPILEKNKFMANPHHRKKHKEHLRQFQHRGDMQTEKAKGSGTTVFAIVGATAGLAILYFATQGNFLWAIAGAVVGGGIGYLIGKNIDKGSK